MITVGLTGGIGSGKTTVAHLFEALGAPVISSDKIVHHLLDNDPSIIQAIVQQFGPEMLQDSKIHREKLRIKVFSDKPAKTWLENLLHPKVHEAIKTYKQENILKPYVIVEIPLLIETGVQDQFDRILVVDCAKETRIARVQSRDNISRAMIQAIIDHQTTIEAYQKAAHDWIQNDQDLEGLKAQVAALHEKYSHS